jgi:hypothetical protein
LIGSIFDIRQWVFKLEHRMFSVAYVRNLGLEVVGCPSAAQSEPRLFRPDDEHELYRVENIVSYCVWPPLKEALMPPSNSGKSCVSDGSTATKGPLLKLDLTPCGPHSLQIFRKLFVPSLTASATS